MLVSLAHGWKGLKFMSHNPLLLCLLSYTLRLSHGFPQNTTDTVSMIHFEPSRLAHTYFRLHWKSLSLSPLTQVLTLRRFSSTLFCLPCLTVLFIIPDEIFCIFWFLNTVIQPCCWKLITRLLDYSPVSLLFETHSHACVKHIGSFLTLWCFFSLPFLFFALFFFETPESVPAFFNFFLHLLTCEKFFLFCGYLF